MKITNKHDLPQALVDAIKEGQFGYKDKCYSVTTILNPTRSILLTKRHYNDLEADVSECINQLLGTATHSIIEKADKTGWAEKYLKIEIKDGYYLTGKLDLYDEKNGKVQDYKTASVYKVLRQDFEDWEKQGLMYSWMLLKQGLYVGEFEDIVLLKDWTARDYRIAKSKGEFYPDCQVYKYHIEITSQKLKDIETFIYDRFNDIISQEQLSDDELLDCGETDTWYTGNKYAVYKKETDARAQRVLDSESEAQDYLKNKLDGKGVIVFRKGEYRKCQDYCNCCKYCKYYEERKAC